MDSKHWISQNKFLLICPCLFIVIILLILSMIYTYNFVLINDINQYTFSVIGNYFEMKDRNFYLLWSHVVAISIFIVNLYIFLKNKYYRRSAYVLILLSSILLVVTAHIPAKSQAFPILHAIHVTTSLLHSILLLLAYILFVNFIKTKDYIFYTILSLLIITIYLGTIIVLIVTGRNGLFQIWFYFSLYFSLFTIVLITNRNIGRNDSTIHPKRRVA